MANDSTLLLDVGNTRCKLILLRQQTLDEAQLISITHGSRLQPIVAVLADHPAADRVLVSSVAQTALAHQIGDWCQQRWSASVHYMSSRAEHGGLRNAYSTPADLGVDRWLAMLGAWRLYGGPLVVIDTGTATTLDWVDASGQHQGGWILPGLDLTRKALNEHTSALPRVESDRVNLEPGRSTLEAIGNGTLATQVGAMVQFIRRVQSDYREPVKSIITGGAAEVIMPFVTTPIEFDDRLVFRGMLECGLA